MCKNLTPQKDKECLTNSTINLYLLAHMSRNAKTTDNINLSASDSLLTPRTTRKRGLSTPPIHKIVQRSEIDQETISISEVLKTTIFDKLHQDQLKQALYFSAANAILIFLTGSAIALWFVFQEFIEPLFWAVLCGALLHPIKVKWVRSIDSKLENLSKQNIPLIFGVIYSILSLPGILFKFLTRVCLILFHFNIRKTKKN